MLKKGTDMIDEEKIYRYFKKAEKLAAAVGDKPLCLGFSGGKDSIVLKYFADKYGIKYEARYNNTQIEQWTGMLPFIRKNYPDVTIVNPSRENSFFVRMAKCGEPSLFRRWCCDLLKHGNPKNKDYKVGVFGVRGAESVNRMKRGDMSVLNNSKRAQRRYEHLKEEFARKDTEIKCYGEHGEKVNVYPIFDLTDEEVWQVIKENNLVIPQPYIDGVKRIGCALCPFAKVKENYDTIKSNPNIAKHWMIAKLTQLTNGVGGGQGEMYSVIRGGQQGNRPHTSDLRGGYLDIVMYLWLYINHYIVSVEECKKGCEKYKQTDLFGDSEERRFRELLTKHGILREDGEINV